MLSCNYGDTQWRRTTPRIEWVTSPKSLYMLDKSGKGSKPRNALLDDPSAKDKLKVWLRQMTHMVH